MRFIRCILVGLLLLVGGVGIAAAQGDEGGHSPSELHASAFDHTAKIAGDNSGLGFLFGAFCALWAQNTRRNPWLWFFLGLFFSVITVIVLLVKKLGRQFRPAAIRAHHARPATVNLIGS